MSPSFEIVVPSPRYVALPCNGAWQPVYPRAQYRTNWATYVACAAWYVVHTFDWRELERSEGPCLPEVTFHGTWREQRTAAHFAWSASVNGAFCTVEMVDLYWYCQAWGLVRFGEPGFVEVDEDGEVLS